MKVTSWHVRITMSDVQMQYYVLRIYIACQPARRIIWSFVACPAAPYFVPIVSHTVLFSGNSLYKCFFSVFTVFLSLTRIQRYSTINVRTPSCKVTVIHVTL